MDKQMTALEWLAIQLQKYYGKGDIINTAAFNTAKALERKQQKQSGWVKCSDRLPTTFLEAYNGTKSNPLVLLDDQGNTTIGRFFIQHYDGGKIESFWNEFDDEITGVTHYIELPVLP